MGCVSYKDFAPMALIGLMNALPHPGLLPKEKENRYPSHRNSRGWICRTGIRKTRDKQRLFLLPGGEG